MKAREALRLKKDDKLIDKETGESISIICVFEEPGIVMIEGVGERTGYNHWSHRRVILKQEYPHESENHTK